jgi:hypothetical protein
MAEMPQGPPRVDGWNDSHRPDKRTADDVSMCFMPSYGNDSGRFRIFSDYCYLEAIAPGTTLASLILESDPALIFLRARESTQRTRDLTAAELKELDF